MTKHLEPLLPLVQQVLTAPNFPEQEMEAYIKRSQQRLKVDLSKNDIVADRVITERIFGTSHPYGYNTEPATFEQLNRSDLRQHFENNYHALNGMLIIKRKIEYAHPSVAQSIFRATPLKKRRI
ncbi:MAG: insulinase family protein [Saprospiraceae bacterium]|nr:insulinase family protein [Saprospiraceae bacterium]